MIAAVTGASGHAGGNIVRCLISHGIKVKAFLHEDERAVAGLDVRTMKGNILDVNAVSRFIQGADAVYHLAGFISVTNNDKKKLEDINITGTRNIIAACLEHGIKRLVHMSSIHALSPYPKDAMMDETRELVRTDRRSTYDSSKACSEMLVHDAVSRGLDAVILNPTAIIGPFDYKPSLIGEVMLLTLRGRMIAFVKGGFDWVDARDVAEAAHAACERGRKGERYILSGSWHTIREIGLSLREASGCSLPPFDAPMWLARLGAPVASAVSKLSGKRPLFASGSLAPLRGYRHISSDKAKAELGYKPRPLDETIRDTYAWFRDNGYIKKL